MGKYSIFWADVVESASIGRSLFPPNKKGTHDNL